MSKVRDDVVAELRRKALRRERALRVPLDTNSLAELAEEAWLYKEAADFLASCGDVKV